MNTEDIKVKGEDLLGKIKELVKEGNIRRIIIKNEEEKILLEIPLTLGVVGAVFAPVLAGIGALAALVTNCTITVVKDEEKSEAATKEKPEDKTEEEKPEGQ